MDQRQTFADAKELLSIVSSIADQQLKASLLVDKAGLTRLEGFITSIKNSNDTAISSITVDDKDVVLLKDVIGVNGVFRSDYSEC